MVQEIAHLARLRENLVPFIPMAGGARVTLVGPVKRVEGEN